MTENDLKGAGPTQTPDPIKAHEEFLTKQLAEATDPIIREMAEKALAFCADLRKFRELDEKIRNAPPEEAAYYAFLDELDRIKKARAAGEMDRDEAFFRIARLILPKATASAEKGLQAVARSLWSLVEKARAHEGRSADEEDARGSIEEAEHAAERMIASNFRLHGEPEIADLYENDLAEFDRRYERGRQVYLVHGGSAERGKH
ncbi:MAG: hypothetical protein ACYC37_01935 [Desulfobacteria bacterium]